MPATADTYKWTDKNGKIIYSDKPNPNGSEEKVKGAPLTTYSPDPALKKPSGTPSNVKQRARRTTYSNFTIEQPTNDKTFRQNAGNVTVKFGITPTLNNAIGDKIEIFLDGKKSGETSNNSFSFVSLNRGTHTLSANLVNRQGTVLKSDSITFHLQRATAK
ncbi:MAG: DUF4124 domain-containing protein [Gammaproteobacteria bacterium]|nr:DUF4124 domain-containing protein [Gammaproteobacteria bacterium]